MKTKHIQPKTKTSTEGNPESEHLKKGFGDVIKGDILNQVSLVELDSGDWKAFPIADLEVVEAKAGVDDDWGDDLDLGDLMGAEASRSSKEKSEDTRPSNKPEKVSKRREHLDRIRTPVVVDGLAAIIHRQSLEETMISRSVVIET